MCCSWPRGYEYDLTVLSQTENVAYAFSGKSTGFVEDVFVRKTRVFRTIFQTLSAHAIDLQSLGRVVARTK